VVSLRKRLRGLDDLLLARALRGLDERQWAITSATSRTASSQRLIVTHRPNCSAAPAWLYSVLRKPRRG